MHISLQKRLIRVNLLCKLIALKIVVRNRAMFRSSSSFSSKKARRDLTSRPRLHDQYWTNSEPDRNLHDSALETGGAHFGTIPNLFGTVQTGSNSSIKQTASFVVFFPNRKSTSETYVITPVRRTTRWERCGITHPKTIEEKQVTVASLDELSTQLRSGLVFRPNSLLPCELDKEMQCVEDVDEF